MKVSALQALLLAGSSVLAITSVAPAFAQETGEETDTVKRLGSVTVTAQRREESANDIGMAIQAFSDETLDVLNVDSVDDLQTLVPGFSVSQSYQGVPTYTLRGIGFNTINVSSTSTVGTYVDEVAYPFPFMNSGPVFDVERVEVLKGPQGTLFGRNTTSGLINIVTNKPSTEYEGSMSLDIGNYDTVNFEGMFNLPLNDQLQTRFSFRQETSGEGWQKSVTRGEDRGTVDKLGFRFGLAWQPTSNTDVDFSYSGWKNKSDTIAGQAIGLTPNTDPTFIVPGTNGPSSASAFNEPGLVDFINNNFPTSAEHAEWSPYTSRSATVAGVPGINGPHEENSTFDAYKLSVSHEFDNGLKIVSLTGYNKLDRKAVLDWSGVPYTILAQDIDGEIKSFSQEIRFEGEWGENINWLAGAYYGKDEILDSNNTLLRDNANSNFVSTASYLLTVDPTLLGFPAASSALISLLNIDPETGQPYTAAQLLNSFQGYFDRGEFDSTTWSVFANMDWDISPDFSLSAGIRYTEDSQDYVGCSGDINGSMQPNVNVFNRFFFSGLYGTPPAAPLLENQCNTFSLTDNAFGPVVSDLTEDNVSWRVVGNWTPADDLLIYGSISQGFKSASVPVNAASKAEQNFPAKQENLLAYEVGIKAGLMDGRMQANGALFFYDYEDKQVSTYFPDPIYRALSQLQNAPTGEAYGLDAELSWLITDELTAIGGLTLLHTEYGSFPTADSFGNPVNNEGDPFLYSPETSLSLSLIYDKPVTADLGFRGALSGRWQSDSTAGSPDDPLYDIDSYGTLNGSVAIYDIDGKWELSLWGQNLTDEYYWHQVASNANVVLRFAGKPRTFGLSLGYKF